MKRIQLIAFLILFSSCTEWSKKFNDHETTPAATTPSKIPNSKIPKTTAAKNKRTEGKEISGTLQNGTLYEILQDSENYIVSFDPFIPKDDHLFMKAVSQIIAKIYRDHVKNEARISIQTDIGYTIVEGKHGRYKIIPYKEDNGTISTLSIVAI